jgi:uncharacterized phage-associated protein
MDHRIFIQSSCSPYNLRNLIKCFTSNYISSINLWNFYQWSTQLSDSDIDKKLSAILNFVEKKFN